MNRRARQALSWLLFVLYCATLVLLLYGASLSLPFFFDDFVHYPFVEANSQARIWLTTDELAYYRPLNFSLWRLTYDLFQRHHPVVDHGINLLLFAANGVLVGWLAGRLWALRGASFPVATGEHEQADWWRVWLGSTLFLLFPFSYQAVPWVGALSHITVTALILLALAFYVQMRRTGRRLWGAASLLTAFFAPFAHENGVLVMPFVVLVELTTPALAGRWRAAARAALIWSLPLLVYMPIWFSLPRAQAGGLLGNSLEGMLQNSAYFLQGASYPFSGVGGWLHRWSGLSDMATVALLSILAVAVALLVQVTQRASLRSLLPWLWIILASLPAVLFLVFDYVINGPRLLMVASVGVSWLWADVLLLFGRGGARDSAERFVRVGLASVFTLLLLLHNAAFVRERMAMHQILGDGFKEVVAATELANAAGQEAIVINFPSWLAPKQSTFALGHEGVLFWPDYVPHAMMMAVHTGELGELHFARVDGIRPQLDAYHYGLTGPPADWSQMAAAPARVLRTEYGAASLALEPAGQVGSFSGAAPEPLAEFTASAAEGSVELLDLRVAKEEGGLRIDTLWQNGGAPPQTTIFLHAVDGAGNLLAQADGDPLAGSYPLEQWPRGSRVLDSRFIPLAYAPDLGLRLGIYDRLSGERWLAQGMDGQPLPDDALAISFLLEARSP